jgi:hypothetical protein
VAVALGQAGDRIAAAKFGHCLLGVASQPL